MTTYQDSIYFTAIHVNWPWSWSLIQNNHELHFSWNRWIDENTIETIFIQVSIFTVEWLQCMTRIHKILWSNCSIVIHRMTMDKSLQAKFSRMSQYIGRRGADTAVCKKKKTIDTNRMWIRIITAASPNWR